MHLSERLICMTIFYLIDVFGNGITNVLFYLFNFIEPHPPTNLSAEIQCRQGYEIRIDWQVNMHITDEFCIYME